MSAPIARRGSPRPGLAAAATATALPHRDRARPAPLRTGALSGLNGVHAANTGLAQG